MQKKMQKNQQEKGKTQRVTLRLALASYHELQKMAKKRQQSLSAYLRHVLLQRRVFANQEKEADAMHALLTEMVYLVRVIAKACEPEALAQARAYAKATMKPKPQPPQE